jgi:membrane protein implicated in regulation of membrane protease activity
MTQWWIIWLIVAALFLVGEVLTTGFFLLWFGVGAIARRCSLSLESTVLLFRSSPF